MTRLSINTNSSSVNNNNLNNNGVNDNTVNSSDNKNNHGDLGSNINNSYIRTASVYDICHPLVM